MVLWFAALASARTMGQKVGTLFAKLSPAALLSPVIALMKGLTDPKVGLLMGQTAENIAFRFGITAPRWTHSPPRKPQARAGGASGGRFRTNWCR